MELQAPLKFPLQSGDMFVLVAVACSSLTAAKLELSGLLQGMLGRTEAHPSHPCVHVNHHLLSPPLGSPLPVVCRVWFLALFPFLRWGRALKLTASLEENPFVPLEALLDRTGPEMAH
jgi:hypothetical protein